MFSAKQQKTPVSRTISAPERKGVKQMVRDSQSSMVNRGVVQRLMDGERVELKYCDLVDNNLVFETNKIVFTEYNNNAIRSGEFTGCLMAAFSFLRSPVPTDPAVVTPNNNIIRPRQQTYIAHVFTSGNVGWDTKLEFGYLETIGLIKIHAMFKPHDEVRDRAAIREELSSHDSITPLEAYASGEKRANINEIGILRMNERQEWIAEVEHQYHYLNSKGRETYRFPEHYKSFNPVELRRDTYYLKGLCGVIIPNDDLQRLGRKSKAKYKTGLYECGKLCGRRSRNLQPSVFFDENGNLRGNMNQVIARLSKGSREAFFKGYREENVS